MNHEMTPYIKNGVAKYLDISPDQLQQFFDARREAKIKTKYGVFTLDFTDHYDTFCITSETGLKFEFHCDEMTTTPLEYNGVIYNIDRFIDPDDFGDDKENVTRLKTIFKEFSNSADVDDSNPLAIIIEKNRKELQTLNFNVDKAKIALANGKEFYSKDRKNSLNEQNGDVRLVYDIDGEYVWYFLQKRRFSKNDVLTEISWQALSNGDIPHVKDELSELFHTGYYLYINEGKNIAVERFDGMFMLSPEYIHVQDVTVKSVNEAIDQYRKTVSKMTLVQQNLILENPELMESICKLFKVRPEDLEALRKDPHLSLSGGDIYCDYEKIAIYYKDAIIINITPDGDSYNLYILDGDSFSFDFLVPNKGMNNKKCSEGWYYIDDVDKCFPGLRYYIQIDEFDVETAIISYKIINIVKGPMFNWSGPYVTNPEDAENFEIDYSGYPYVKFSDSSDTDDIMPYKAYLDMKNQNKE